MPTLLDYRRRIRSVKNTQQITRAMKFVAAAALRRAQDRVLGARPYAREIVRVLRSASARIEEPVHPLLAKREENRLLVLLVSGEKGLCGAFNTNVLRKAFEFRSEHQEQKLEWLPIGKKGRDALRKRQYHFVAEYVNVAPRVEFRQAKEVAARAAEMYTAEEIDGVYAIYNEFKNVLSPRLMAEKLLPIEPERFEAAERKPGPAELVDYIYEQPPQEILGRLLPRYLEAEIYRVMLESAAAEQAARMTAMDSATNNAADLIDQLTLDMNKIRQAAITKEIIEVVSGAASTA